MLYFVACDMVSPVLLPFVVQGRQFERVFSGQGADEDVVVGSARAYVSALNKLISYYSASKQVSAGHASTNVVPTEAEQRVPVSQ